MAQTTDSQPHGEISFGMLPSCWRRNEVVMSGIIKIAINLTQAQKNCFSLLPKALDPGPKWKWRFDLFFRTSTRRPNKWWFRIHHRGLTWIPNKDDLEEEFPLKLGVLDGIHVDFWVYIQHIVGINGYGLSWKPYLNTLVCQDSHAEASLRSLTPVKPPVVTWLVWITPGLIQKSIFLASASLWGSGRRAPGGV